jgi:hypothetical protein
MTTNYGLKHIMNFMKGDTLKLDRVCRMLREVEPPVNYMLTIHEDEPDNVTLWAFGRTGVRITKAFHQELKARAIGVVFAIEHQDCLVGTPKATLTEISVRNYAKSNGYVTLPSEEYVEN